MEKESAIGQHTTKTLTCRPMERKKIKTGVDDVLPQFAFNGSLCCEAVEITELIRLPY